MRNYPDDQKLGVLVDAAQDAKKQALAIYSQFNVGAALETADGRIYSGFNIESSSYGLTVCAERVALFKALSEGERAFRRIAVATDTDAFCSPCGACRQVMWDYAPDLDVYLVNRAGKMEKHQLRDLIPHAFDNRMLKVPGKDEGKK